MRLYKYISPVLLLTLVLGVTMNADNVNVSGFNNLPKNSAISRNDVLKQEIDKRLSYENIPPSDLDQENYKIVRIAYDQVGNVGGEKFWSWYGFGSHVPWCCCFISWCADQLGLIDAGIIPKFAAVSYGANWFMEKDQWLWGYETPEPGMVIFFDFANANLEDIKDGRADHVGFVKNVKDGYVYCIEGNYNDSCRETKYQIGHTNIFGYGTPKYR